MALTQEQMSRIHDPATRAEIERLQEQEKQSDPKSSGPESETPVEERRGTSSPTGKYRLGSTIDIPLSALPGVAAQTQEEVLMRQKIMAEKILAELGDDKDPEAVTIRHRVESGNVDELELAQIWSHLSAEGHQKARDKMRADADKREELQLEQQEEVQARKDELDAKRAERLKEKEERAAARQKAREEKKAQEPKPEPVEPPVEPQPL